MIRGRRGGGRRQMPDVAMRSRVTGTDARRWAWDWGGWAWALGLVGVRDYGTDQSVMWPSVAKAVATNPAGSRPKWVYIPLSHHPPTHIYPLPTPASPHPTRHTHARCSVMGVGGVWGGWSSSPLLHLSRQSPPDLCHAKKWVAARCSGGRVQDTTRTRLSRLHSGPRSRLPFSTNLSI